MSRGTGVAVAGVGARTAVGKTAPASAAAVRAGIIRVREHPFLFDGDNEPILVAQTSYLEIDLSGSGRLAQLAGPAAAEALGPLTAVASRGLAIPVFVGLPSPRPGRPPNLATDVSARLQQELAAMGLRPSSIRIVETGHAAGTMAVQEAWQAVRSGEVELALAGGVDSYLEVQTMNWLRESGQIHGAEQNAWGFVPGEAAGFVLLAAPHVAARLEPAAIEVLVVATAHETKLIKTEAVCLGEGLTALFQEATCQSPSSSTTSRWSIRAAWEPLWPPFPTSARRRRPVVRYRCPIRTLPFRPI